MLGRLARRDAGDKKTRPAAGQEHGTQRPDDAVPAAPPRGDCAGGPPERTEVTPQASLSDTPEVNPEASSASAVSSASALPTAPPRPKLVADPKLLAAAQGVKFTSATQEEDDTSWRDYVKPRHIATVATFDRDDGCGFLEPHDKSLNGGGTLFVHRAAIQTEGPCQRPFLQQGSLVSFVLSEDGCRALEVKDEHGNPIVVPVDLTSLDLRSHTEQFRGPRPQQQDRWAGPEAIPGLGTFFGVYDGHGGIVSSEHLAATLHTAVAAALPPPGEEILEGDVFRILRTCFARVDEELMESPAFQVARDGSTALVAIFSGQTPPSSGERCGKRAFNTRKSPRKSPANARGAAKEPYGNAP